MSSGENFSLIKYEGPIFSLRPVDNSVDNAVHKFPNFNIAFSEFPKTLISVVFQHL